MEIKWNCPHCNTENTDITTETAVPLCSGCDKDVHWGEIVEIKDITTNQFYGLDN